jgi:rRNA-processing protein FCF1
VAELRAASQSENGKERAVRIFKKILSNFKVSTWFESAAFKQHSMITKTTKEVHEEFKELKRKGAFKILIKILYKKIAEMGV